MCLHNSSASFVTASFVLAGAGRACIIYPTLWPRLSLMERKLWKAPLATTAVDSKMCGLKDIIESLISSVAAMMVLRRLEGELWETVGDLCWYLSDGAIGSLWASVGVCRPLDSS